MYQRTTVERILDGIGTFFFCLFTVGPLMVLLVMLLALLIAGRPL